MTPPSPTTAEAGMLDEKLNVVCCLLNAPPSAMRNDQFLNAVSEITDLFDALEAMLDSQAALLREAGGVVEKVNRCQDVRCLSCKANMDYVLPKLLPYLS